MTSPRQILGLDENATKEDARRAWRNHVRKLHPDHHGGDPEKAETLARMNAAWEDIEAEDDMAARINRARYSWTPDEHHTDAMKEGAILGLTRQGFARLNLVEDDLPGVHIVEKMAIDDDCIYLMTGSRAAAGKNELFMPDLGLTSSNPADIRVFPRNIRNLPFEAPKGATSRHLEVGEIKVGPHFRCRVVIVLDPEGGSWDESFATALRMAAIITAATRTRPAAVKKPSLREKVSSLFGF